MTLDFEMEVCLPSVRDDLRNSILGTFKKVKKFYGKNKGKLLYVIEGDTPKAILENFLKPFEEGHAFEDNRQHYQDVLLRINTYFDKLSMGTINHLGETEIDRIYDRLFNQFRSNLIDIVPTVCDSIEIWYKRTQLWNQKYSKRVN